MRKEDISEKIVCTIVCEFVELNLGVSGISFSNYATVVVTVVTCECSPVRRSIRYRGGLIIDFCDWVAGRCPWLLLNSARLDLNKKISGINRFVASVSLIFLEIIIAI